MIVTPTQIEERRGDKGRFWVVSYDGGRLYVWDKEVAAALREGETYEVEVRGDRFPRIVKAQPAPSATQAPQGVQQASVADAATVALLAAARIAGPCGLSTPEDVLRTADLFYSWLTLGSGASAHE